MEIIKVKTPEDIKFAGEAILEFRPNLDPETYVEEVLLMMKEENFELAYIPTDDHKKAAAFVGFRTMNMLRTGRIIYIDDLFTLADYRGKGYAGKLLNYVEQQALNMNINAVHLDSGFTLHPAHRLYLNTGYILACHHFAKTIPKDDRQ